MLFFFFPSPALPSRASTLLRDSWQEEVVQTLGGWIQVQVSCIPFSQCHTHPWSEHILLHPDTFLLHMYSRQPCKYSFVLSENSQTLLVNCVFARNSPWPHAVLFSFLPFFFFLFSNAQLHFQAYSFSLVGWLKKHERSISFSRKHGLEWEKRCIFGVHSLLDNERYWQNNCAIYGFEREYSL